jgi:hypothetical protein
VDEDVRVLLNYSPADLKGRTNDEKEMLSSQCKAVADAVANALSSKGATMRRGVPGFSVS